MFHTPFYTFYHIIQAKSRFLSGRRVFHVIQCMSEEIYMEKTNVMRILDRAKVVYKAHYYESDGAIAGVEVAEIIGKPSECVFKTLVTCGKSGANYVFVIPVAEELDLKKAAAHVGEKSIEMLKSKNLLPTTGYVHGGCSPIGMKKQLCTTVHYTAEAQETIVFSAGKIGAQVEMSLETLRGLVPLTTADITVH